LNQTIADQYSLINNKQGQITDKNTKIADIDSFLEKKCKNPRGIVATTVCNQKKQQENILNQDVQTLKNSILLGNNTINQLTSQMTNKQRSITQQSQLIVQYTIFINEYESCDRQLKIKPILTSPFMSGESHISGEMLVSGEIHMSGEEIII